MTPDQINRAIAEHCGWQFLPERDTYCGVQPECWEDPEGERYFEIHGRGWAVPPNYHGDLNAMHEVIRTMKGGQCVTYIRALANVLDRVHSNGELTLTDVCDEVEMAYHCVATTSAQQAEAFLRTIGKWKE